MNVRAARRCREDAQAAVTAARYSQVPGDLNLVLVVIAVGLAALDLTFAVSQKTLTRLPVTRVVCDDNWQLPSN